MQIIIIIITAKMAMWTKQIPEERSYYLCIYLPLLVEYFGVEAVSRRAKESIHTHIKDAGTYSSGSTTAGKKLLR